MGFASHAFDEAKHPRGPGGKFAEIESAVHRAVAARATKANGWVSISEVRKDLRGHSRADVDHVLVRMTRRPDVDIAPESNQKVLSAEERAGALMVGNQPNHIMRITGNSPSPAAPTSAPAKKAADLMKSAKKPPAKKSPTNPASGVDAEIKAARTRAALTALASRYGITVTALHSEKHIRDMIRAAAAKG